MTSLRRPCGCAPVLPGRTRHGVLRGARRAPRDLRPRTGAARPVRPARAVPPHALLGSVEHALGAAARGRARRLLAGRRLRPRGPAERPDVDERPRLPRAAGVRARRRPAQRALALLGQGGHAAGAAVPRVPHHARRGGGRRRPARLRRRPRSSRPPSRWRPRWRSAPWPTASRSTSACGPRVASPSAGEALLDETCHYALAGPVARSRSTSGTGPVSCARTGSAIGVGVVVSGSTCDLERLLEATAAFGGDAQRIAVRVDPGVRAAVRGPHGVRVLEVADARAAAAAGGVGRPREHARRGPVDAWTCRPGPRHGRSRSAAVALLGLDDSYADAGLPRRRDDRGRRRRRPGRCSAWSRGTAPGSSCSSPPSRTRARRLRPPCTTSTGWASRRRRRCADVLTATLTAPDRVPDHDPAGGRAGRGAGHPAPGRLHARRCRRSGRRCGRRADAARAPAGRSRWCSASPSAPSRPTDCCCEPPCSPCWCCCGWCCEPRGCARSGKAGEVATARAVGAAVATLAAVGAGLGAAAAGAAPGPACRAAGSGRARVRTSASSTTRCVRVPQVHAAADGHGRQRGRQAPAAGHRPARAATCCASSPWTPTTARTWSAGNRTVENDSASLFQRIGEEVGARRPGRAVRVSRRGEAALDEQLAAAARAS